MKLLGRTPPFREDEGALLPGSIAEIAFHRVGGADQWVMMRGTSLDNPPLVALHGGPGIPETSLMRHFNAALEASFTVVYWEQRGAGKSFDGRLPGSSMTIARLLADLDAVVDLARERLRKNRVVLYGHSWGSALGALYAARYPQKVAAFVGAGQVGDMQEGERATYAFTLAEADRRGERRALRELRDIGAPPHTAEKMFVQRRWLFRFVGAVRGVTTWHLLRMALGGPESSILDLPNLVRGMRFSAGAMWTELSALNLAKSAPGLDVPVFFFLGRHDRVVPPECSLAYFETLTAPSKELVWFEDSAHMPAAEEPKKFNRAMAELVRPVVDGAPAPGRRLVADSPEGDAGMSSEGRG